MKTAIAYASMHHGNTKKLVDAIAARHDVALVDAVAQKEIDLGAFDVIGIASGVAYGRYYSQMLSFLEKNLPRDRKVFFIHTAGAPREGYDAAAKAVAQSRGCTCLGTYCCKGFDTYGPFRLVGGIAKGHPTDEEIAGAVSFYAGLEVDGK